MPKGYAPQGFKKPDYWFFVHSDSTATIFFYQPNSATAKNAVESAVQSWIRRAFVITLIHAHVQANAKTGNTVINLRAAGALITGATLTIGSGVTGEVDSGALTSVAAGGQLISAQVDQSAGGANNIVAAVSIEVIV